MYLNLGLVGHPLDHTLSPTLHTHFLARAGLNGGYCCFDVSAEDELPDTVAVLAEFRFSGLNVTVPYKEAALALCSELAPSAERAGAVNTLVIDPSGEIIGHNTDIHGFSKLLAGRDVSTSGKRVCVIGAGGASRAVFAHLSENLPSRLVIVNRTTGRIDDAAGEAGLSEYEAVDTAFLKSDDEFDIIIHTTSLGLDGTDFPEVRLVCREAAVDLQYGAESTPFLRVMQDSGAECIDGFMMLVHQAHEAFRIWSGVDVPVDEDAIARAAGIR